MNAVGREDVFKESLEVTCLNGETYRRGRVEKRQQFLEFFLATFKKTCVLLFCLMVRVRLVVLVGIPSGISVKCLSVQSTVT